MKFKLLGRFLERILYGTPPPPRPESLPGPVEADYGAIVHSLVMQQSRGNVNLVIGNYITDEDREAMRKETHGHEFVPG